MSERSEFTTVNHSVPRGDGVAKVTGSAIYASDIVVERMAWAKLLRSPFAHARIVSIDASAAKKRPGVIDVLTGADLNGLNPYYGHAVKDHPLIAIGKARFVGEPVAAVIAEDEFTAQEALKDVAVEYEELTLGVEYHLEKITDLQKIMAFGVMLTPALVVDGQVKVVGKVPDVEAIKTLLS